MCEILLPVDDKTNEAWLGSLAMAFIVTYMIFALPFGWLADRMPRWRLVGLGVMLNALRG